MEKAINKINFIIIAGRRELAGSQRIALAAMDALAASGHSTAFFFTRKEGNGNRVFKSTKDFSYFNFKNILKIVTTKSKTTIITHGNIPLFYGIIILLCRRLVTKETIMVNHCHGHLNVKLSGLRKTIAGLILKSIYRCCHHIVVCRQDGRILKDLRRSKILSLPNYLPSEFISSSPRSSSKKLRGVSIIRSAKQKGDEFVNTNYVEIENVLEKNHCELYFVEKKPFAISLENMKVIKWMDFPSEIQGYDYFVSFAIYESHPLAVLEAIMNGVPVFLSNIEAHREFNLPPESYFDHSDFTEKFETFLTVVNDKEHSLGVNQKKILEKKYPTKTAWSKKLVSFLTDLGDC